MRHVIACAGFAVTLALLGCGGGSKSETPKESKTAPTEKAVGAGSPTFPPPPSGPPSSK